MASCENKYTTLLDLSRQAKIITGETACFNGKIEAGIPFSGYPTGVDTGTTVSLGVVSTETAVFSGNTGTTIFDVANTGSTNYNALFSGYSTTDVWTNDLFSGNTSGLTLPITSLSADTQIVGPFWTLTQTGMTGDYVIGTQYTGYSITYSFRQVEQLNFVTGYTAYSGFSSGQQENFSAGTLDYKGPLDYISSVEDATVDGRLTTDKLTVTGGASASTIGYVLTQLDSTGKAGWAFNSASASTNTFVTGGTLTGTNLDLTWNTGGSVPSIELSGLTFTGNTSGDCINSLYLTNLYGCSPLHIEPSGLNDVYIVENGGNVGIGTATPSEKLDVLGSIKMVDGNEQNGYVMTSDVNGVGSWQSTSGTSETLAQTLAIGNTTGANNISVDAGQNIIYNNGLFDTTFGTTTLTGNQAIVLPNASGTVALLSDIPNLSGSGTNNKLVRWTPNGTTLGDSLIEDDGSTLAIGAALSSSVLLALQGTAQTTLINVINLSIDPTFTVYGGKFSAQGASPNPFGNVGIRGSARNGVQNIGVAGHNEGSLTSLFSGLIKGIGVLGVANPHIGGGDVTALAGVSSMSSADNVYGLYIQLNNIGAGTQYIGKFQDGSQGLGKFIKSIDAFGTAQWADITSSDISGTISPTSGGTGITTYTTGDILYASAANVLSKRAIGTVGQVLTVAGGVPTWAAAGGGATIDPYQNEGNVNSITWDVSGTSTNYEATLTGDTTLTMSNVRNGDYGTLIVTQDGTGSRTLTFGAGTHRVVNGGGGSPTLTATAGHTDILSFTYNGSTFYWTVGNDYT